MENNNNHLLDYGSSQNLSGDRFMLQSTSELTADCFNRTGKAFTHSSRTQSLKKHLFAFSKIHEMGTISRPANFHFFFIS